MCQLYSNPSLGYFLTIGGRDTHLTAMMTFVSGVYFGMMMLMCTLSVIMTIIVLNLHHRSPDMYEMPDLVRGHLGLTTVPLGLFDKFLFDALYLLRLFHRQQQQFLLFSVVVKESSRACSFMFGISPANCMAIDLQASQVTCMMHLG